MLRRFAELAVERGGELTRLVVDEAGKMPSDAAGEVKLLGAKVTASLAAWAARQVEPFEVAPGTTARLRHRPIGTLAVFGPFNFPLHLPNGHLVPALLAGNSVVFKPSEHTPACGEALAALFHDAGVPQDVLQVVQGGRATGQALVDSNIDGVLFTGSEQAGDAIAKCLRYDQMLALELGGNNPIVVHEPADVDAAIELVIQSAFISSGQRCTCARRLIVTAATAGRLVDQLVEAVRQIHVGKPTDEPEPMVGPLISKAAASAVLAAQEAFLQAGAKSLLPSKSLDSTVVTPGLIDTTGVEVGDGEVFGPLLQVVRVASLSDAIAAANATRFGLAAGIVTRSRDDYEYFVSHVRAGCINWNRPLTGASGKLPFGGVGRSGNYRPAGATALDYCTYPVASLESEA